MRRFPLTPEQTVNVLTEFGPLVALFIFTFLFDFKIGTWALVLSTAVALVVSLWFIDRVPIMPFLGGGVSIAFGAASLLTDNPMWVMIKVTIFNALFALLLLITLARGKSLLQHIFGKTFMITPEGWRRITLAWAAFFVFTSVVNEVVRQIASPQIWAAFKVFFVMPVAGLFGVWQARLVQRYKIVDQDPSGPVRAVADGLRDSGLSERLAVGDRLQLMALDGARAVGGRDRTGVKPSGAPASPERH